MAIVNLVRFHRVHNPILSASKMLTFGAALMSIFALQTAMLTRFGGRTANFWANGAGGAAVCLMTLCLACHMILKGGREIRRARAD